ncbi:MAG: glycosyltransferase family 4 protein [Anaerolineae bacterium]
MRIGIVTGEYPPMEGGVGAYTRILAEELSRLGQKVLIFSCIKAQSVNPDIPVVHTVRTWNLGSLLAVREWTKTNEIDIVNIQFQTAAYGMSPWIHFLPHVLGVPVVTTFHDLRFPYLFPKAGLMRKWIVRHLAQASAGVIVTNHEDDKQLTGNLKKCLIPIGSNILRPLAPYYEAATWRKRAGAEDGDILIAYFGLINRSKGLDTLLESLGILCAQGVPARLVIIGGSAGNSDPTNIEYVNTLKERILQQKLDRVVHWTGYLHEEAEVAAYLTASDVVALPFNDGASFRRGSLMAAVQYGCAIVSTTPTVEIPEFIHGENMLLVPANASLELVDALHEIYDSDDLRQTLQRGATALAKHFDWKSIAEKTINFFDSVYRAKT